MSDSKYPELHEFMGNLYQAGMSIEQTVEHGFQFAFKLMQDNIGSMQGWRGTIHESPLMLDASKMVYESANELGISLAHQRQVMYERGSTHD